MARVKKINSQEVGLEIGLIFCKYFMKTEYLHYGLFEKDIAVDIWNLGKAQDRYADLLLSQIPDGVKTILDVGCGSGKTAQYLTSKGYEVECVSPSRLLNEYARNLLGESTPVHTKKFEEFETDKKFDLVLFSESFQYIPIKESLGRAIKYLKPQGDIIVADFFRRDDEQQERGPLGGGHKWTEWTALLPTFPLETIKERDITNETSLMMDLVNGFTMEVIKPAYTLGMMLADDRYPKLMKFIKWKFKKKLDKIENKHFQGERNSDNFKKYKRYMMYHFQVQ